MPAVATATCAASAAAAAAELLEATWCVLASEYPPVRYKPDSWLQLRALLRASTALLRSFFAHSDKLSERNYSPITRAAMDALDALAQRGAATAPVAIPVDPEHPNSTTNQPEKISTMGCTIGRLFVLFLPASGLYYLPLLNSTKRHGNSTKRHGNSTMKNAKQKTGLRTTQK